MKDEELFPTFANFLLDELYTFFLCSDTEDKNSLPKELLENEKKYAWTFTNNFIMEYRDQFDCDITSLHNFAIGYIRIVCMKDKTEKKTDIKNLQKARNYIKLANSK